MVWYFQLDCIMSCLMSCTINLIGLPKSTKWQQNPSLESITWSCHLNLSHKPAKMTGSQDHPNITLLIQHIHENFATKNNRLSIFWISVQYFMLNILYSIQKIWLPNCSLPSISIETIVRVLIPFYFIVGYGL